MIIKKLSSEVQNVLRTGIVITDPTQCVIELVENSLDAQSTCVAVRVDLENFILQVVDNGHGLTKEELDLIGSRYMTSKCHSIKDLKTNLKHYGFRGESLASIRESCKILMIISRHKDSKLTHSKIFRATRKSNAATVAAQSRLSPGTTVVVKDFLYNFPVRRDRIQPAMEMEDIRHALIALSIINFKVSFTLRNDVTKMVLLQTREFKDSGDALQHHCNMKIDHSMVALSTAIKPFRVSAKISRDTEQTGRCQFIYVNKTLIKNKNMYKLVNEHLSKSFYLRNIGKEAKPGNEKLNEKPVFIINIKCPHAEYDITSDPRKCKVEFLKWDVLMKCLEETVKQFIITEGELNISKESANNHSPGVEPEEENLLFSKKQENYEYPIKSKVLPGAPVKRILESKELSLTPVNLESEVSANRNNDTYLPKTKLTNSNKSHEKCSNSNNNINKEVDNNNEKSLASAGTCVRAISQQKPINEKCLISSYSSKRKNKVVNYDSSQQSDLENPLLFKFPTQKHFLKKRKLLSEHITTETESDVTPKKQRSKCDSAVTTFRNKNKTSILPIVSEEFFNNSIKNILLGKSILFDSAKAYAKHTPTQTFQINMYRSVKEDRRNNFLKFIKQNSVQYIDVNKDKHISINCYEGSQSTISKHDNGFKTILKQHPTNSTSKTVSDQSERKLGRQIELEKSNKFSPSQRKEHFKHNWKIFSPIFKHLTNIQNKKDHLHIRKSNHLKFERNIESNKENETVLKHPHPSTLDKYNIKVNSTIFSPLTKENKKAYLNNKGRRYQRLSIEKHKTTDKPVELLKDEGNKPHIQHLSKAKTNTACMHFKTRNNFKGEKIQYCSKIFRDDKSMLYSRKNFNKNQPSPSSPLNCHKDGSQFNKSSLKSLWLLNTHNNKIKQRYFENPNTELTKEDYSTKSPQQMHDDLIKQTETCHDNYYYKNKNLSFISNNKSTKEIQNSIIHNTCKHMSFKTKTVINKYQYSQENDENCNLNTCSPLFYNERFNSDQQNMFDIPPEDNFTDSSQHTNPVIDLANTLNDVQIEDTNDLKNRKIPFEIIQGTRDLYQHSFDFTGKEFLTNNIFDSNFKSKAVQTDSLECDQSILETFIQTPNSSQFIEVKNKENNKSSQILQTKTNENYESNETTKNDSLTNSNSPCKKVKSNSPFKEVPMNYSPLKEMQTNNSPLIDVQTDLSVKGVQITDSPLKEKSSMDGLKCDQLNPTNVNTINIFEIEHTVNTSNEDANDSYKTDKIHTNPQRWNIETTPNGRMIYIQPITGMSSFLAPAISDDSSYVLNNRHWFMTKGTSPLLQINCSTKNIKQLTDIERNVIGDILVSNVAAELETVKWKNDKVQGTKTMVEMLNSSNLNLVRNSHLNLSRPCVFSSESLHNATVLGQVDEKFIAAILQQSKGMDVFLVLFDQHAVDERIRLEHLMSKYKESDGQIVMQLLNPHVEIMLDKYEISMITELQPRLTRLGLKFEVEPNKVFVSGTPLCLFNRVTKQNDDDLLKNMLRMFIKQMIISVDDFHGIMPSLPQFLSDIINSEACRGAIKFGNNLTVEKCKNMISKLALCEMPFQCAHGRPVLTPLAELKEPTIVKEPINLRRLMRKQLE